MYIKTFMCRDIEKVCYNTKHFKSDPCYREHKDPIENMSQYCSGNGAFERVHPRRKRWFCSLQTYIFKVSFILIIIKKQKRHYLIFLLNLMANTKTRSKVFIVASLLFLLYRYTIVLFYLLTAANILLLVFEFTCFFIKRNVEMSRISQYLLSS